MNMNSDVARENMIAQQVRAWDVLDPRVLGVMERTPRERFVPERYQAVAFADTAIPLAHGQFMLAPKLQGRILQALELSPHDRVLEVGTGSGFLTACLAALAFHVTSIDIYTDMLESAGQRLRDLGIENCDLKVADVFGMDADQSYDAIAVTGSIPQDDGRFDKWLRLSGRLFLVVGEPPLMEAWAIRRVGMDEWQRESLFETSIPALIDAPNREKFEF
jgi:protein-L-isoaspartate(D-aspartate) O-methyltransferase